MKNIYKIFLLSFLVFAVSCENEDDSRFTDNPEFGWIEFQSASSTLAVNSSVEIIPVTVNFTAPINTSDVTVTYSVESVSGVASDVVGSSGTLTIAANTSSAIIELNVLPTAAATLAAGDVSFDVVLDASSRGIGVGLSDGSATVRHRINLVCDIALPLGGMYTVFTTYGAHDFLPSFATNTATMEIVDNGDGTFFTQDFSGGLYNGGPYTSAYGTGATSFDFTFSNACTQIVWENQDDGFGSVVPDGVNEYDFATGVMTTSWLCEGYGENGVSIWTPL